MYTVWYLNHEFKTDTVLEYYKCLASTTKVLFVYISPKECQLPASLQKITKCKTAQACTITNAISLTRSQASSI